jgi:hypothetical protein
MTRELEPDNAGARSHCVAANALRAFCKSAPTVQIKLKPVAGHQLKTIN